MSYFVICNPLYYFINVRIMSQVIVFKIVCCLTKTTKTYVAILMSQYTCIWLSVGFRMPSIDFELFTEGKI